MPAHSKWSLASKLKCKSELRDPFSQQFVKKNEILPEINEISDDENCSTCSSVTDDWNELEDIDDFDDVELDCFEDPSDYDAYYEVIEEIKQIENRWRLTGNNTNIRNYGKWRMNILIICLFCKNKYLIISVRKVMADWLRITLH